MIKLVEVAVGDSIKIKDSNFIFLITDIQIEQSANIIDSDMLANTKKIISTLSIDPYTLSLKGTEQKE
jgi:hypothetical protein